MYCASFPCCTVILILFIRSYYPMSNNMTDFEHSFTFSVLIYGPNLFWEPVIYKYKYVSKNLQVVKWEPWKNLVSDDW